MNEMGYRHRGAAAVALELDTEQPGLVSPIAERMLGLVALPAFLASWLASPLTSLFQ